MISLNKDYSSLFRWQANNVPFCNYSIASMKVCYDFGVLAFFLVYEIILVVVGFVELLGIVDAFLLFMSLFWLVVFSCRTLK
jgi:hypothetical protein